MAKFVFALVVLQVIFVKEFLACSCGCGLPGPVTCANPSPVIIPKPVYQPSPVVCQPQQPSCSSGINWEPLYTTCGKEEKICLPSPSEKLRLIKQKFAIAKRKLFAKLGAYDLDDCSCEVDCS